MRESFVVLSIILLTLPPPATAVDKSQELDFLKEIVPLKVALNKALEMQQNSQKSSQAEQSNTQDDAILFEPPHKNKRKTNTQADKAAKDQGSSAAQSVAMEE